MQNKIKFARRDL